MEFTVNLNAIILYVQDVESLKQFYTNAFGLKVIEEYQSEWVLLATGATQIGLHKIGAQYENEHNSTLKYHNNTKLVFEISEDINTVRNYLITQNALMREVKTFDNYDYWLCDGEDPEGNVFQLKQRK